MKKQNFKKMLNLRSFALVAIFSVAILATSCNKENDGYIPSESEMMLKNGKPDDVPRVAPAPGNATITELALASPQFSVLVDALIYVRDNYVGPNDETVDLVTFFTGSDQYTVFAPNNDAFVNLLGDLNASSLEDLDPALVLNILLYHVTDGRRAANSVVPKNGERIIETLLEGATFAVKTDGTIEDVDMRGAQIVGANTSASNGIIHEISEVILPIDLPDSE